MLQLCYKNGKTIDFRKNFFYDVLRIQKVCPQIGRIQKQIGGIHTMSTLKKLLAITLALAMVLSVSAFAGMYSAKTYKDAAKINGDCEEAVELMYALDIMSGNNNGEFMPEKTITRAEVAKMIFVILNYGKTDASAWVGAKMFDDVAAGSWYEGYVNYCAAMGIVAGYGNGKFGPADVVTGSQVAKMLLTAIGEDSIAICSECDYRANMEAAESIIEVKRHDVSDELKEVSTPNAHTIEEVCDLLKCDQKDTCKAVVYQRNMDDTYIVLFIRGDLEANETKLTNFLGCDIHPAVITEESGLVAGFIGPVGLCDGVTVLYDRSIEGMNNLVCGANKAEYHRTGLDMTRDVPNAEYHDFAKIIEGGVCPHCGKNSGFEKETDTLDGWFDSGSTHFASMKRDQGFWPADMYMEGLDQYRGWFQSSLLVAVGALGMGAPYKECLTHGWTVDGEGKAMHKSLGNGVDPADMVKEFGADIVRLWAGSADYHVDVRCSKEIFKQLSQNYLKFRNTARYCLGNLDGFDANDLVKPEDMEELDRWAVTKLNELIEKVADAYNNYEFHVISHAINDFCVVELSSFYLDIIKDRLYCEEKNGLKRRSAQTALYLILDSMAKMFAPILAFTCDEIWLSMPHRDGDDVRNIVLNQMNKPFADYALDSDAMAKWDKLIALRGDVNGVLEAARADKRIGKPLEAAVALRAESAEAKELVESVSDMNLSELFIVSQCLISDDEPAADAVTGKGASAPGLTVSVIEAPGVKCPRCWMHSEQADAESGLCPRCAAVVAKL